MLKIIVDSNEPTVDAQAFLRHEREKEKKGKAMPTSVPGGRGLELDQCSNCSDPLWVPSGSSGWGYCRDCKPEKKKNGVKLGFFG